MHALYEILSINSQDITGTPRFLLQEDVRANQAVFGVNFDSRHRRYCLGPFAKGNAGNEDPNLCTPTGLVHSVRTTTGLLPTTEELTIHFTTRTEVILSQSTSSPCIFLPLSLWHS